MGGASWLGWTGIGIWRGAREGGAQPQRAKHFSLPGFRAEAGIVGNTAFEVPPMPAQGPNYGFRI